MTEPMLYTIDEAAELLRISRAKFYTLVAQRRIATVTLGGCRRVERTALEKYITTVRSPD